MDEIEWLRKSSGVPLFDIVHFNWNPNFDFLERYVHNLYERLVSTYKQFEMTQEYLTTRHVLIATGTNSEEDLDFAIGGGSTTREAACTHGMGWALSGILDKIKDNPEPFSFRLFIVGYNLTYDGGEPSRLFGKCA